jgi:two-component system, NtrC family, response regulator
MTTDRKLLIVEDDPGLQSQMRWCVEDCEVFIASDAERALQIIEDERPQVMTLDLGLPPDPGGTSQGFLVLQQALRKNRLLKVIVITGREEKEHALKAIEQGAYDFYQKPIDAQTLTFVINRAFRLSDLEQEITRLSESNSESGLLGLITADPQMLQLCRQVHRIAATDASIAILGETGSGKEVIARNIHDLSRRADGPFVAINCAALPENLLESELFGYEKGAFTGANTRKIGKIEVADGGTLFLDEIGDMPAPLQSKILRFLQERSFERLGGNQSIAVDVRVLSATHQDLQDSSQSGFREDLFYRLGEIVLVIPPLRDRSGDALLLARHFLNRHSEKSLKFSPAACVAIEGHEWPGNVRELENRVKRACILCENSTIEPSDLELGSRSDVEVMTIKEARAAAESDALNRALLQAGHNVSEAARLLGISRPTLYNLLEKYNIEVEKT